MNSIHVKEVSYSLHNLMMGNYYPQCYEARYYKVDGTDNSNDAYRWPFTDNSYDNTRYGEGGKDDVEIQF